MKEKSINETASKFFSEIKVTTRLKELQKEIEEFGGVTFQMQSFDTKGGEDFISFLKENNRDGPQQEHIFSLDMAKELCLN